MNRLKDLGLQTINSLWFFPAVLTLLLAGVAIGAVAFDLWLDGRDTFSGSSSAPWVFSSSPEGARAMLGTIAGALITAAGVTFSGVLVALSIASSQYTSRILSSFVADRLNQFTVGLIVGAFVYCLVVMRTIGAETETFVPEVAVSIAILLGAGAVCNLVLFVHSVAQGIQASEILRRITEETIHSLKADLPESSSESDGEEQRAAQAPGASSLLDSFDDSSWRTVQSRRSGYLRTVDFGSLVRIACRFKVIVRMERAVGSFVHEGTPLLSFLAVDELPEHRVSEFTGAVQGTHTIGSFRTVEQDPAFGIRQLVDIALRALSPGINDTTTAVMAIERITEVLLFAARRIQPDPYRYVDGQLRLCSFRHDLGSTTALGYDQIYESSRGNQAAILALVQGWVELARAQPSGPIADHTAELLRRVHRDVENERALELGEWPGITAESDRLRALLGVGSA